MQKLLVILLLMLSFTAVKAEDLCDSTLTQGEALPNGQPPSTDDQQAALRQLLDKYAEMTACENLLREEMRFDMNGAPLLVRGLIESWTHHDFYKLPSTFRTTGTDEDALLKKDNYKVADYVPALSPLAAAWLLKACGVKSRSTTKRMATAGAMALGLTVGLTEGLKQGVREWRPDGSDEHSFPSGHSAIAFMSATVLSREYGHISPWISVGGYALATGTQMLRIRHNAHWMNDIFVGAGIGTVSTNLAYYITDRIYGRSGVNPYTGKDVERIARQNEKWEDGPSGFRLISGTETCGRTQRIGTAGRKLRTSAAMTAGVELDWALDDHWMLEAIGRISMAQAKWQGGTDDQQGEAWNVYHANLAAEWSTTVLSAQRVGLRALGGVRHSERLSDLPSQTRPEAGVGLTVDLLSTRSQMVGFSFDYLHTFGTQLLPNRCSFGSTWKVMF